MYKEDAKKIKASCFLLYFITFKSLFLIVGKKYEPPLTIDCLKFSCQVHQGFDLSKKIILRLYQTKIVSNHYGFNIFSILTPFFSFSY